ncbi:hypothetical protein K1719_037435 [Acacia pycnantha]|nr:hypothetical protein K1719_037435 [Acacia pycnantha]
MLDSSPSLMERMSGRYRSPVSPFGGLGVNYNEAIECIGMQWVSGLEVFFVHIGPRKIRTGSRTLRCISRGNPAPQTKSPMAQAETHVNGPEQPINNAFPNADLNSILSPNHISSVPRKFMLPRCVRIKNSALGSQSLEEDDLLSRSSKKLKNDSNLCKEDECPSLSSVDRKQWEKGIPGTSFAEKLQGIKHNEVIPEAKDGGLLFPNGDVSDDDPIESDKEDSEPLCKPNRRKKGSKDKQAVDPHQSNGSRFKVLVDDVGRTSDVVEQKGSVIKEAAMTIFEAKYVEEPRGDTFVRQSNGKSGASRKKQAKQGKGKRLAGESDLVMVGRKEQGKKKRNRDKVHREEGEIVLQEGGKSRTVAAPTRLMDPHILEPDPTHLGMDADDPPTGLGGRFWAHSASVDPDVEFVAETMEDLMGAVVNRLTAVRNMGFDGLACVPSIGRSGGILAAWKSNIIDVSVIRLERQMIHLRCQFIGGNFFNISAIYAIPDSAHKQQLWSLLGGISTSMTEPWAVLGDFNDIASPSERTGGLGYQEARFSLFSNRIQSCDLFDLGGAGKTFET